MPNNIDPRSAARVSDSYYYNGGYRLAINIKVSAADASTIGDNLKEIDDIIVANLNLPAGSPLEDLFSTAADRETSLLLVEENFMYAITEKGDAVATLEAALRYYRNNLAKVIEHVEDAYLAEALSNIELEGQLFTMKLIPVDVETY